MTLEERMDGLERQNRRLKRAGALALAGVASLLLLGAARGSRLVEAEAVKAKAFVLVDDKGRTLAALHAVGFGTHLVIKDEKEVGRVVLGVSREQKPYIRIDDPSRKTVWSAP